MKNEKILLQLCKACNIPSSLSESPWKCSETRSPQLFFSITDFVIEETDNSTHILITVIDSTGQPEETKRFDKKINFDYGKWIQVGS